MDSMRSFFTSWFEYHHLFNQKLIAELERHAGLLPERSFPLFCHVLNAHQIWNSRILGLPTFGVSDIHSYEDCESIDKENYRNTMRILENRKADEEIVYKNSRGHEFANTVSDILFHISNHSTHHKGQILSDFRQSGLEPLVTDYIFYRR